MLRKRFRELVNVNVAGAIGFVVGTLLSALISVVIDLGFHWDIDLIVLATLLLVAIVVFFLGTATTHIQHLAETLIMRIDYVEEPYRASDDVPYRGDVYKALERQVRLARRSIVVVAAPTFDAKGIAGHKARVEFLKAINDMMKANAGTGFTYVRVLQVPLGQNSAEPRQWVADDLIHPATYLHCRDALRIEQERARQGGGPPLQVEILVRGYKTPLSPFIIIDDRWIVVETDGVAELTNGEEQAYIANFFFLDDQLKRIIPAYNAAVKRIIRNTRALSASDFPALPGDKAGATIVDISSRAGQGI